MASTIHRRRVRQGLISDAAMPSLFLYPGLLLLISLTLFPFLYVVYISFTNHYLPTPHLEKWVGLRNYTNTFADPNFLNSVLVTTRYIVVAVGLELVFGFLLALLLHSNIRFRSFWRGVLLIPIVLTPIVAGAVWKLMYNAEFGIIPYVLGLVGLPTLSLAQPSTALWAVLVAEVWQATPFVTLIILAGLTTLPVEVYEAASVDGASPLQTVLYITLPLLKPFLVIALVLRFIATFRTFDLIYIMTNGGPGVSTQDLALRVYEIGFNNMEVGKAAALAVMFLIVAIIVTRFFILKPLTEEQPKEVVDL